MTAGEHTILIDGLRFHFRVSGEGSDVVLLHGWGCSTDIWKGVEAELSKNFKVWNIDFPGFGLSEAPTTPWGVEEYTRNFEQFCAMNSISRPTLIGHSFGGRISIVFASRNEVDKIVLVDAAGVLPPRGLKYYTKVYSYKAMKFLAPLLLGKERGKEVIDRRRRASAQITPRIPRHHGRVHQYNIARAKLGVGVEVEVGQRSAGNKLAATQQNLAHARRNHLGGGDDKYIVFGAAIHPFRVLLPAE